MTQNKKPTVKQMTEMARKEQESLQAEMQWLRTANSKYLESLSTMAQMYQKLQQLEYALNLGTRALDVLGVKREDYQTAVDGLQTVDLEAMQEQQKSEEFQKQIEV